MRNPPALLFSVDTLEQGLVCCNGALVDSRDSFIAATNHVYRVGSFNLLPKRIS
jgi:hypothetical protein